MTRLLVRLYPARWRDRYGDEFEALLNERPIGPFDVADILLGAIDARLHVLGGEAGRTTAGRITMSIRVGGIAALIGAPLWAGAFAVARGDGGIGGAAAVLMITGSLALLVALAGLSAFQARTQPGLSWAAFALPAIGTVLMAIGALGSFLGRDLVDAFFLGLMAFQVGTVLFAVATLATRVLSRVGAVLLAIGPVLAVGAGGGNEALTLAALACLVAGWFATGLHAVRFDSGLSSARAI
jgi:hypothetical protein